ncbi:MAG TPA: hypothetical protein VGI10_04175 [Polyangiaceae bacterium]|jgi:hypothetical protein
MSKNSEQTPGAYRLRFRFWLAALALLLCAAPRVASAAETAEGDPLERWSVDPGDPAGHLPKPSELDARPVQAGYLLMDLVDLADSAVKAKNYPAAIKFYGAIAKLVPERATAYSKLCEVYAALKDREHALENCRIGMSKPGVDLNNAALLVSLLSDGPGSPNPTELAEIDEVIGHLKAQNMNPVSIAQVQCGVAVQLSDQGRLAECTKTLRDQAPDDVRTLSYAFSLAMLQGDYQEGDRLIARAKATGVRPEGIQKMELTLHALRFGWMRKLATIALPIALLLLLLVSLKPLVRRFGSSTARA